MAKLRRQVRRTKEVLSANTAAPMTVEELHGGRDFQSSIKREEFEKMAGDYFKRAAVRWGLVTLQALCSGRGASLGRQWTGSLGELTGNSMSNRLIGRKIGESNRTSIYIYIF